MSLNPKTYPHALYPDIYVAAKDWPDRKDDYIHPGDLNQFAPYGNGVYGFDESDNRLSLKNGPIQESCGGTLYFGSGVKRDDFQALARIAGVPDSKDYVVFGEESTPQKDGYITQLRIVSKFALRHLFNSIDDNEYSSFNKQKLNMANAMFSFIEVERNRLGGKDLRGMLGGDGYWAYEDLSFGFMVENDYFHVYRIWSRVWVVTK